uniref:LIM zinc-binding domain-containing protein n=1 Tax=Timema bartmani TaxID=61472 RepID=A0A7R9ES03_9NEOP|nr:unnamed protein product [Timema bartmani]
MNKKCARCEKTVYPIEELKCLDKIWHKQCFRCNECNMTLNMRTYKGFNKQPYCEAFPVALYATFGTFPRYSSLSYWYEYEGRPDETCYTSSFGGVTDVIHRVSISLTRLKPPPRPRYPPTSFSSLQLLKSYMSNSTSEDRLNGLHVHTSRGVSYGPMWKNARSGPELELSQLWKCQICPRSGSYLDQFWPDMIFPHGEDEVLNELSMNPRKINIRLNSKKRLLRWPQGPTRYYRNRLKLPKAGRSGFDSDALRESLYVPCGRPFLHLVNKKFCIETLHNSLLSLRPNRAESARQMNALIELRNTRGIEFLAVGQRRPLGRLNRSGSCERMYGAQYNSIPRGSIRADGSAPWPMKELYAVVTVVVRVGHDAVVH